MNVHNFVSIFKNAQNSRLQKFTAKKSKIIVDLLQLLTINGYISAFVEHKNTVDVYLKYSSTQKINMSLISKPSRKVYMTYQEIVKSFHKNEFLLVLTKQGLLTSKELTFARIGGEVLIIINN